MTDESTLDQTIEARNQLLRDKKISPAVIRKAWFTLSHVMLDDGAHVVDMGCDSGAMTFAMAALHPQMQFTGLDKDKRKINKAKTLYELDNLDYKVGDPSSLVFPKESLDAIIDSYVLHKVYSGSRYNEQIVSDTLAAHHAMLKKGGQLFLRDYARPPPEEFVLMEMPDVPSKSDALKDLSEADLLVWYAEHARPKNDPGCGGFFLEELPAKFPKTRLFRLPHKWAYEFIMRKDDRSHWESELPMEYTFFTKREIRKAMRALGMRVQYASPHWNDDVIAKNFEGHFRLYSDDGKPMDYPPVCYIAVGVKMAERKSLAISERRPSHADKPSRIKVTALRDQKTGKLIDIARRDTLISEVVPYRVSENGRLKVYLHDGLARSIINSVPRSGSNIGDQRWSGHMIETVSVESDHVPRKDAIDLKSTVLFARDHLGVKPYNNALLEVGPDYYPAPDYIDERIYTYFLKVSKPVKKIKAPQSLFSMQRFQAKGDIREFDAQQILDAISVGMIPNARLELQILALFQHLGIKAENWTAKQIKLETGDILRNVKLRKLLDISVDEMARFRETKGSSGQLRPVNSIFVEEGQSRGAPTGLAFEDIDFIVHNNETVNVATVLPLTKDLKKDVHAGFLLDHLPVPARHQDGGQTIAAQRFNLPPEVTNLRLAKKFLAEKYAVLPENVIKLGEPYFTHIGLTPQKIHPFAVAVPHKMLNDPANPFLPFYQMMLLRKSLSKSTDFAVLIARAYRLLSDDLKLDARMKAQRTVKERFAYHQPDWSIPMDYYRGPSLPDPDDSTPDTPSITKAAPLKAKPADITLQENLAPNFKGGEAVEKPAAPTTVEKVKGLIKPLLPKKPKPEDAPSMAQDFEAELEEFIEDMDAIEKLAAPRPEKW